jgi:hypothetical protein
MKLYKEKFEHLLKVPVHGHSILLKFWGEVFQSCLCYLIAFFTNELERMISLQGWYKCKPIVTHMKVFKSNV